jgi:hypothetical protein
LRENNLFAFYLTSGWLLWKNEGVQTATWGKSPGEADGPANHYGSPGFVFYGASA